MSFHPIRVLDRVTDEYRDYLRTEFRARDPQLRQALEAELGRPRFLAQEPFYQAHRPFKPGKAWHDLPIDPRLAEVMAARTGGKPAHVHQSEAIEHLLGPSAGPLVVTTGTGSGKTEAFLLPVLQNAIADAVRFQRSGLTAILVYPMNALANDQLVRIEQYLAGSGWAGAVEAKKYDRLTSQADREALRRNPPRILLTNYMMLEYLLVRPADREEIFANHRCRFLVLDEVHTYRGTLGSHIALLVRRLRAHLRRARQEFRPDVPEAERSARYPGLIPVGTSATIKSVSEAGLPRKEVIQLRDAAVKDFFGKLAGAASESVRVLGEELEDVPTPVGAVYPPAPVDAGEFDVRDLEAVRRALCRLSDQPADTPLATAAERTRLLWDLNRWLVSAPMSLGQIVARVRAEVSERAGAPEAAVEREVTQALLAGAALPDGVPGALRLRSHRMVRGGWRFHRCVDPACGRLYPMGENRCECGQATAPLYLCRNCGADALRFAGDPDAEPLRPAGPGVEGDDWMLYDRARIEGDPTEDDEDDDEDDEEAPRRPRNGRGRAPRPDQMGGRPVRTGSFDPATLAFSRTETDYPLAVVLAPRRTRCLACGATGGSRDIVTPVALGTSAAVKTLSEALVEALADANRGRTDHDGKERLLVFSDSRQDAAHQARFIAFASRYDRMRRRLVQILEQRGEISLQDAVQALADAGLRERDNKHRPQPETDFVPRDAQERMRAWEEAPLLDELAVTAAYRATVPNLGLVALVYDRLDEYVRTRGQETAGRLGIDLPALEYICRCLLDEMRMRSALSRTLLRYHPMNPNFPENLRAAEWERRIKTPHGYALGQRDEIVTDLDRAEVPPGLTLLNAWRRAGARGRGPRLQTALEHLVNAFGGPEPDAEAMRRLLEFLVRGKFLMPSELFGYRDSRRLLQVNAEALRLSLVGEADRRRCDVCSRVLSGAPEGFPCPRCHGRLARWAEADARANRNFRRARASVVPLVASEHTAMVPSDVRADLETRFKAPPGVAPDNLLACSPTLEMGIDVGGLDAVVLRNVPPRPDNYAQRGGRAGRRSRVGLVVSYARSTPHDQYFYDRPAEMISGEVPAPALALGNRDVIIRHLHAIAFGSAEPGLASRMADYVTPQGEVRTEAVEALVQAVQAQAGHALALAGEAWGADVLREAELGEVALRGALDDLPRRIRDVIDRTARQVRELRQALDVYAQQLTNRRAGTRAGDLVARILGIPTDRARGGQEDDLSAGYPMRRFAEAGILPGYEFPTEPASLRLLGDEREADPVTVARRFGLAQFQPDAQVYARTRRWKSIGLDTASPWNPQSDVPAWGYRRCATCELRYHADEPRCTRCGAVAPGRAVPGHEYAGFVAKRDENPVLNEEERYPTRNLVQTYPQWDGQVVARWTAGPGWALRLSREEEVRWLNEGLPVAEGAPADVALPHGRAKGFLLCGACGRMLRLPENRANAGRGRRAPRRAQNDPDPYGHGPSCPNAGQEPEPIALVTAGRGEVLRLLMPVPPSLDRAALEPRGLTLGYALRTGMRRLYMLDGPEIEFEMEGPWRVTRDGLAYDQLALTFIDPSLGGSGYLRRIADEFHLVARQTLEHLDHPGCDSACYRCLKSYQNQRFHDRLRWPLVMGDLEALAEAAPQTRPLERGDLDDPGPWAEAFREGLGSPLELRFWRLFEAHGFRPEKQVPISPDGLAEPITVADFAVPGRRLAIYVDGAAFHTGPRLARDRRIRQRLREANPPWRVEELRATDLSQGAALVARLLAE